jgi:radical SAM protein with 4Fe4S-binding SPASM domain
MKSTTSIWPWIATESGAGTSPPSPDKVLARLRRFTFQWHLTERCNLRCAHCYQESYNSPELGYAAWLEVLDQLEQFLADWRAASGSSRRLHVTLTGGEPFVHPDLMRLLEVLADRRDRFSFAILSNGHLIDRDRARLLARLSPRYVQVSLEGTAATHDRIRGPGSFERVVSAIRELTRIHIPVMISFTAHRGNFRELPAVVRLAQKMGVTRVWTDRLIPLGAGAQGASGSLTPAETLEYVGLLKSARQSVRRDYSWWSRRRTEVSQHRALQFLGGEGVPYRCVAGESLLALLPNGDLLPCRRMPIRLGNVLETPLRDLYFEHSVLRALRNPRHIASGCEGCALERLCRGGLRCLSFAMYQDPFHSDPGCWLAAAGTILDRRKKAMSIPRGDRSQ